MQFQSNFVHSDGHSDKISVEVPIYQYTKLQADIFDDHAWLTLRFSYTCVSLILKSLPLGEHPKTVSNKKQKISSKKVISNGHALTIWNL